MPTQKFTIFPHLYKRIRNLNGQFFGKLFVIGFARTDRNIFSKWLCKCECDNLTIVRAADLLSGNTQSCGCWQQECRTTNTRTHGRSRQNGQRTPEYRSWEAAKRRCQMKSCPDYTEYGERGIEFRFESFEEFFAEVGLKPTPKHVLDRIKVNGHYEIGNVKWSTPVESARNKRTTVYIKVGQTTKCLAEWSELSGIPAGAIRRRIDSQWCADCAVTVPIRKGHCIHIGLPPIP